MRNANVLLAGCFRLRSKFTPSVCRFRPRSAAKTHAEGVNSEQRRKQPVSKTLALRIFDGLFFNQKQQLTVAAFRLAHPIVRPAHSAHYVAFVINLHDFDEFSGFGDGAI